MYVLQCGKYNHIVNWKLDSEQDEHHFIVQDIDEFSKQVLPIFFKVAKYESFQRKLYRWGFIKTRRTRAEKMKSPKSVCYVHPCFRQGDYNGAAQMTCSGASVEICKSTQKHRKRQQRQKGSKDNNSKRQRASATATAKNEDLDQNMMMMMQQQPAAAVLPSMQESTTVTAMPGLNMQMHPSNNFLSFPQNNNMFMMMNALPSNDPNALQHMMPVLAKNTTATMPSTSNILGNERIQNSFAGVISRDSSSLNTTGNCNAMMSKQSSSSTTATSRPAEDNIPQLLARARTQREIKRIQMNNLMRDEMLRELQTDSPVMDGLPAGTDVNMPTTTDALVSNTSSATYNNDLLLNTAADNLMEQDNSNGNLLQFNPALNSGNMYNAMSMNSNNVNYTSFENSSRKMHQQIINDAFNALMRSS